MTSALVMTKSSITCVVLPPGSAMVRFLTPEPSLFTV